MQNKIVAGMKFKDIHLTEIVFHWCCIKCYDFLISALGNHYHNRHITERQHKNYGDQFNKEDIYKA